MFENLRSRAAYYMQSRAYAHDSIFALVQERDMRATSQDKALRERETDLKLYFNYYYAWR